MAVELFWRRRFWPLFVTQFFGAFNDNFLKAALLSFVTFEMMMSSEQSSIINNLALAVFIVPYLVFSAPAGQLADKFNKAKMCVYIKWVEVLLMFAAALAFYERSVVGLLVVLFLMGTQSTFFGPLKYALLPLQLSSRELMAGNAYFTGGTYLAILIGSISGTLIVTIPEYGIWLCSVILIVGALIGVGSSTFILSAPSTENELKIGKNILKETVDLWRRVWRNRFICQCILAISGFWLFGALFASQLPVYSKVCMGGDSSAVAFFYMIFSIGISLGAVWCSRILKGCISFRFLPASAMIMTICSLVIAYLGCGADQSQNIVKLGVLMHEPKFIITSLVMTVMAISGGFYIVPLYAAMQHKSPRNEVSRIISGNNVYNSVFMTAGSVVMAFGIEILHLELAEIFTCIGLVCGVLAFYAKFRLKPLEMIK